MNMKIKWATALGILWVFEVGTLPAAGQFEPPEPISYVTRFNNGKNTLYTVNTRTGLAKEKGLIVAPGPSQTTFNNVIELEFTPDGKLFGIDSDRDSIFQINPENGLVLRELPLSGDLSVVPQHAGLAWYERDPAPGAPNLDSLILAIGGTSDVPGGPILPPAIYTIDHETGQTIASLPFLFDPPFPFNQGAAATQQAVTSHEAIVGLRQINPLRAFTTGGVEHEIIDTGADGGKIIAGDAAVSVSTFDLGIGETIVEGGAAKIVVNGRTTGIVHIFERAETADTTSLRTQSLVNPALVKPVFRTVMERDGTILEDFTAIAIPEDKVFQIIPGDANLDGFVNAVDLNIVALGWQQTVGGWVDGDFNNDLLVNAVDLNTIALNWLRSVKSIEEASTLADEVGNRLAAIPEPTTGLLLGLVVVTANRVRRRVIAA